MAKNKKRPHQQKKQAEAIQKPDPQKRDITEKNKKENEPATGKNSITHFLFGHTKINKKDLIEIIIVILFTAFLIFMHLKTKEII